MNKIKNCVNVNCSNVGLLKCSKCMVVPYCCQQCQRLDWPKHKIYCELLSCDEKMLSCINQELSNKSINDIYTLIMLGIEDSNDHTICLSYDIMNNKINDISVVLAKKYEVFVDFVNKLRDNQSKKIKVVELKLLEYTKYLFIP